MLKQKYKTKQFLILSILLISCKSNDFVPKPIGYPKLDLIKPTYTYNDINPLFKFKIPQYAFIVNDTLSYTKKKEDWYNVFFKDYNANLHLTYYKVSNEKYMDSLIIDTRKLVGKQMDKAMDIIETPLQDKYPNLKGAYFQILGHTATNINFYIQNNNQFLRGALYFNYKSNSDSIAPIFTQISQDIDTLLNTFIWKKN